MAPSLAATEWSNCGYIGVGLKGTLETTFASKGEPGTGLVITVCGDAIDQGLVVVESIGVRSESLVEVRPSERVDAGGRRIAEAAFPDHRFGESSQDPAQSRLESFFGGPRIDVVISLRGLALGEAMLRVGAMAMASASSLVECVDSIRTTPTGRRPLRFPTSHPVESSQNSALLQMGGTDTRFALIVMDEDDEVALPLVREIFGAWVESCTELGEGPGELECILSYPRGVVKFKTLAVSGFPARKGWKSVLASLPHLEHFEAGGASGMRIQYSLGEAKPPSFGFALAHDGDDLRDDVVLPHVVLWEQGPQRDARDRLTAMVRSIVGRCDLVQAVVTRCAWVPKTRVCGGGPTAYEEVCGVSGPGLAGQAWTTRWLRWCAERTWIGGSLLEHLGSRAAELEPFIAERKAGVLELHAEDVDALERVLAPILPAASEPTNRRRARS